MSWNILELTVFSLSFSGPQIESPFCHILSVSLWEMVTIPNLVFVLICRECSVHHLTKLWWWLNGKIQVSQSAWSVITKYHKPISIHNNGWFSYSAANPGIYSEKTELYHTLHILWSQRCHKKLLPHLSCCSSRLMRTMAAFITCSSLVPSPGHHTLQLQLSGLGNA